MISGALPRAPETSFPFAIETLEGSLELLPGELSSEGLKAYRRPNTAVFVNTSVDVGRIELKPCLTQDGPAINGEPNNGSLASLRG